MFAYDACIYTGHIYDYIDCMWIMNINRCKPPWAAINPLPVLFLCHWGCSSSNSQPKLPSWAQREPGPRPTKWGKRCEARSVPCSDISRRYNLLWVSGAFSLCSHSSWQSHGIDDIFNQLKAEGPDSALVARGFTYSVLQVAEWFAGCSTWRPSLHPWSFSSAGH